MCSFVATNGLGAVLRSQRIFWRICSPGLQYLPCCSGSGLHAKAHICHARGPAGDPLADSWLHRARLHSTQVRIATHEDQIMCYVKKYMYTFEMNVCTLSYTLSHTDTYLDRLTRCHLQPQCQFAHLCSVPQRYMCELYRNIMSIVKEGCTQTFFF